MHVGIPRPTRRLVSTVLVCLLWLVLMPAPHAEPVTLIRNNGSSANRVDLLILGDGYTQAELDAGKYANDVETFVTAMFAQEPYFEYRNYYNVRRVDVASAESGADHPELGTSKNTAFDATYNCSGIQRLVCVNTSKVNAVITASGIAANERDATLVIVNDNTYGGSGGAIAVASTNSAAVEIILHEVGHSFGLLADEYGGPPPPACVTGEPSQANATRQTERDLIKWAVWIDPATPVPTSGTALGVPGLYQGAVYCDTGAYRPTYNSKMRSLNFSFDQINTEQHVRRIYNLVSPIDSSTPAGSSIPMGLSQLFGVGVPIPRTHSLDVTWRVDGVQVGTGTGYTASGLSVGSHTVTATIHDATPMVRSDPSDLLTDVRSWTVNVAAIPPSVTSNPSNQTAVVGTTVSMTGGATGLPAPSLMWQLSTNGGISWSDVPASAPYSGTTSQTLTIDGVTMPLNGNRYRVMAMNSAGSQPTNGATLTVRGSGVDLMQNGSFTNGLSGWFQFALPDMRFIVSSVAGGVLHYYQKPPPAGQAGQAVVYQETGVSLPANAPLVAQFDIGNSSGARKRMSVLVIDSNFTDLFVCTFWLAPASPLRTYRMKTHSTRPWANAAIYFYSASADDQDGYLLDNVSLTYDPAGSLRTDCIDPTRPTPTATASSANLVGNGDFNLPDILPWGTFGDLTYQLNGGVFNFLRPGTAGQPAGVVLQNTMFPVAVNQVVSASLQLGNSSGVRKRATVLLHDNDFTDLVACTFWLAPGQPLSTYTVKGFTTKAWAAATISVYAASIGLEQWTQLDNVVFQVTPSVAIGGTECGEPIGPPPLSPASRVRR